MPKLLLSVSLLPPSTALTKCFFSYIYPKVESAVPRAHVGQCCLQRAYSSPPYPNFTSVAILPVASIRLPVSYMMDLCSKQQICSYRAKDFVLQKTVYKITHQFKRIYSNIHQIGVFFKPGILNRVKVLLREEWTRVFSTPHIHSPQSVMWVNLPWIFSPQFYQFQKL